LDFGDGQWAAVHVAALDDQRLVVLGELLDRLRGVDRLAGDERDRGGAAEQLIETLDAGFLGGALNQRVLGDPVARRFPGSPAELGEVGCRQPPVLGDDGGRRLLEPFGDLGNRGGLVSSGHAMPPRGGCGCATATAARPEMTNAPTQTGRGAQRSAKPRPPAWAAGITPGPSTDCSSVTDGLRWNHPRIAWPGPSAKTM